MGFCFNRNSAFDDGRGGPLDSGGNGIGRNIRPAQTKGNGKKEMEKEKRKCEFCL